MKNRISLRWFLSLQLGAALVLQFASVAILAWLMLLPQMRADIGFRQHALARVVAGEVATHVLGGKRQLSALAEFIDGRPSLTEAQWMDLLDAQCGKGDLFEAIYITDAQGKTIRAVGLAQGRRGKRRDLMGLALSERNFPRIVPSPDMALWSDTFSSAVSGRLAVAATLALREQIVIGEIALDRLSAMIREFSTESGLTTMILDRRGIVIADSQGVLEGQPFDEQQFAAPHELSAGVCRSTPFDLHGQSLVGTLAGIEQIGWKALVAQPSSDAYRPIRTTFLAIVLGLLIAVALALTFQWFQSKKLARLFNLHSTQARAIAEGHYDVGLPEARTKEFFNLAENLRQMAHMIRQREQRIVDSENNLKITLDSIGDAVIATDAMGLVTRMNPAAEHLTGWSLAEANGKPLTVVFRIFNSKDRQTVANPVEKVLAEGKVVGLANDTLLIAKNGQERQVADSAAPIRRADGRIVGVVMVFRDVTEIHAKEQKIRENERLLNNLTANVPGVVYQIRVKPSGVYAIDVVNQQLSRIFGLDVAAEEKVFPAFIARIPEEERDALIASLRECVRNLAPWHWEGRFNKPSGETIWFSGNAICRKEGEDKIFYGFLMDTTERKQWESALRASERRFKDLFNEAPVMYVITENRNQIPYVRDVNNLFLETLGYDRQDVIDTPLADYYNEASRREVLENGGYKRALGGEFLAEERNLITRDGRTIHTLLHTRPEYDDAGHVVGTRAMFLDITRRKHAEQESERLASALLQSQKMEAIGTLAGGIAHDFNNILSAVIGYTDLSMNAVEKHTRLHQNLEQILVAGLRARDLVQQILAFSRQEDRELRPLQVGPLVKEALKLLRSSLPSTIEMRQQIGARLDNVLADPTQIHRIIMNLCTNAAHAMEENGGQLTVTLSQVALTDQDVRLHPGLRPGDYIQLSVQDTGKGMAPEILSRIFEPYFSTKSKGKGTGLGLSVVHGIVTNHGGAVFAYSEPGQGSIFHAYIPAVKREVSSTEPEDAKLPTGNEHILLVDDEPVLIDVGQAMLETLGYQVTTCDGSLAALAVFQKNPQKIDLVISDVTMPKMTGDKLAAQMLRVRKDLPIILCTGFSDKVSSKGAADMGVKAMVMKPFVQKDLAILVRKVLDAARTRR